MEYLQTNIQVNNKIKIIKELLEKQVLNSEKKRIVLSILNYLEYRQSNNKDDIHLQNEIEILYDCIL
tara:strand:- start:178 stop:378 length:201 start_codon:yes stop_codon:yes gene_type:complete